MSFFARALFLLSFACAAVSAFSYAGGPVRDEGFSLAAAVDAEPEAERLAFVLGRREELVQIRVKALPRPPGASLDPQDIGFIGAWSRQRFQHPGKVRCSESFDTSGTQVSARLSVEMRIATGRQSDP